MMQSLITIKAMENTKQVELQPATESKQDGLVTGFFAIGMVINIALLIAYVIWAYRQWGKRE